MNNSTESIKTFPLEKETSFADAVLNSFIAIDANLNLRNLTPEQYCESFCDNLKGLFLMPNFFTAYTVRNVSELANELKNAIYQAVLSALPNVGGHLYFYLEKLGLLYNEKIDYEAVKFADKAICTLKNICQQLNLTVMNSFDEFEKVFGSRMSELGFTRHERFREIMKYHFDAVKEEEKKYNLGATGKEKFLLFVYGFLSIFGFGIPLYRNLKASIKARNRATKMNAKLALFYGQTKPKDLPEPIKNRKSIKKFIEEFNKDEDTKTVNPGIATVEEVI